MPETKKTIIQTLEKQSYEPEENTVNLEDFVSPFVVSGNCVGRISHIDPDTRVVYVDYSGNPSGGLLPAKLGRPFTLKDLEKAIDYVLDVKLEFENNNPATPVITNVYYSILDNTSEDMEDKEPGDIHIKGKRIIIEGETEIVIKSGGVSTTYAAQDGKLVSKAVDIISEALHNNKVRGASIKLN